MARIDDYHNARRMAVEALSAESLDDIQRRSGFEMIDDRTMQAVFLDRIYSIRYPDFVFKDTGDQTREVPIQEQVLILHYLQSGGSAPRTNRWVSYREIPGASFYYSAFVKRAVDPLKQVFGEDVDEFSRAAQYLGGRPVDAGDAACELQAFPRVPIRLIVHRGDEEFPAEATILFDQNVDGMLSPEDIAWLAGMTVYRLIALSRRPPQ
jgi:hypothetical protein